MKKILFLVLLLIPLTVNGYENDYIKIDINENYEDVVIKDNTYTWSNKQNNDSIIISIENNSIKSKQDIKNFSEKDIKKYKTYIENTINDNLKEYNLKINVSEINKIKINEIDSLYYLTYWPTKESFGYDMYQNNYVFTTNKYITTITFITDEKNNSFEETLKTLSIKDSEIENNSFFKKKSNQIIIIVTSCFIIGYIIPLIFRRK